MKIVRQFAGHFWAFWGLISFALTFLVIFIPAMLTWLIPGRAGQVVFVRIARLWMNAWLLMIGCPVTIRGREHFAQGQTYIVTCNHNSLLDVPLSSPYIPGANKTIAKSSFAKVPLFGFFYMRGSVLVNRHSEQSRRDSFDKMKQVLAQGIHMCIYPEGTRNRTDAPLKKFHDGAFRLAVMTQTLVIPAVIFNTKKALPVHKKFFLWPQRLYLHFLAPVAPGDDPVALRDKVFAIMEAYYVHHHP